MGIHFEPGEFSDRRRRTCAALLSEGLDGLLVFRQESMYYLTGYDTFGYCFFQCLYLSADGQMTLLTRAPDLRQARHTSQVEDIRIWVDGEDVNPALALRDMLLDRGARGTYLGVELDAYGLTALNLRRVEQALEGVCALRDASYLVSRLRLVKSAAELVYVREAATLADRALTAGVESTAPGAWEGDILAEMQGSVFRGGGDYPGNEFIIGSGRDALLCRYFSGRRHLDDRDQLTLELAGSYRRYHACLMRTVLTGPVGREHRRMHAACVSALDACTRALKPGRPLADVFDAHARALDDAGYREHRMNACGYSLGATFTPTWMDWPMLYAGSRVVAEPGMVFFIHIIVMNSDAGLAMTVGHTVLVGTQSSATLSALPLELNCR